MAKWEEEERAVRLEWEQEKIELEQQWQKVRSGAVSASASEQTLPQVLTLPEDRGEQLQQQQILQQHAFEQQQQHQQQMSPPQEGNPSVEEQLAIQQQYQQHQQLQQQILEQQQHQHHQHQPNLPLGVHDGVPVVVDMHTDVAEKLQRAIQKSGLKMRPVDLFTAMDHDHNGYITWNELQEGLFRLGLGPGLGGVAPGTVTSEVQALLNALDKNGDGKINVMEWREGLLRHHHHGSQAQADPRSHPHSQAAPDSLHHPPVHSNAVDGGHVKGNQAEVDAWHVRLTSSRGDPLATWRPGKDDGRYLATPPGMM
jgi:hypothetical protein